MMLSAAAFECHIFCHNCGNVWRLEFQKGWAINQKLLPKEIPEVPFLEILNQKGKKQFVECPICASKRLQVVERKPIGIELPEPIQETKKLKKNGRSNFPTISRSQ